MIGGREKPGVIMSFLGATFMRRRRRLEVQLQMFGPQPLS